VDASAAGNCAHNSENYQDHVMNAAIGAVVVSPGAAIGFVFVDPAGNCAHNSENYQDHVMNAAIGAVVVTPGAAVGFVFVDPAGNCAHNSENYQEHVMNAAIGAVVVTPGAAVGFVFVDHEVMWSGSKKIAAGAATTGDLPAAAATSAAFDLAKNHCA